ncbi:MAG: DpnD/PcfM family protein [Clostridia bacterium]|nr:DpnD/PcfM family protein [Clostridia bacterium]
MPDENEAEDTQKQKAQYRVTITETLKFTVGIDADSAEAAERIAEQNWKEGNYIIDSAHFAGVEFHAEKE